MEKNTKNILIIAVILGLFIYAFQSGLFSTQSAVAMSDGYLFYGGHTLSESIQPMDFYNAADYPATIITSANGQIFVDNFDDGIVDAFNGSTTTATITESDGKLNIVYIPNTNMGGVGCSANFHFRITEGSIKLFNLNLAADGIASNNDDASSSAQVYLLGGTGYLASVTNAVHDSTYDNHHAPSSLVGNFTITINGGTATMVSDDSGATIGTVPITGSYVSLITSSSGVGDMGESCSNKLDKIIVEGIPSIDAVSSSKLVTSYYGGCKQAIQLLIILHLIIGVTQQFVQQVILTSQVMMFVS